MSVKRIPSEMTALEMGIEQVKELSNNRAAFQDVLDIVAADGIFINPKFLRPLQGHHCGITARLRRVRVFNWAPEQRRPGVYLMKPSRSKTPNSGR